MASLERRGVRELALAEVGVPQVLFSFPPQNSLAYKAAGRARASAGRGRCRWFTGAAVSALADGPHSCANCSAVRVLSKNAVVDHHSFITYPDVSILECRPWKRSTTPSPPPWHARSAPPPPPKRRAPRWAALGNRGGSASIPLPLPHSMNGSLSAQTRLLLLLCRAWTTRKRGRRSGRSRPVAAAARRSRWGQRGWLWGSHRDVCVGWGSQGPQRAGSQV